jgi:arylsulfatase A-like enzyme
MRILLFVLRVPLSVCIALLIMTTAVRPLRAGEREDPLIVWIVIDTLRADHLGSYGYPRNTSPNLDRLAMDGIRFENAIAPSSWTLPSFTSMLTGLYPPSHGILRARDSYVGADEMLAEILKKNGFKTASFQRNTIVSDERGILRGFDTKVG